MELIEKLGLDVKLLLAQIVTFVILLTILTYLVYKPILNLLDKRKSMIEKNVEDTRRIEERLAQLEKERAEVLAEASKKAMAVIEQAKAHREEEHQGCGYDEEQRQPGFMQQCEMVLCGEELDACTCHCPGEDRGAD